MISLALTVVMLTGCGANQQAVPPKIKSRIQAQPTEARLIPEVDDAPKKRPKDRVEMPSRRSRFSTRYLNPDGTFTEEIFMEPQFYKDKADKKWKKIDNTLALGNKKKYENKANDMKVRLADTAGEEAVMELAMEDKSVAFLPVGVNKIKGKVKDNTLTYKGLFKHVDATYRVQGGSIKEDLILNNAGAPNTFGFELRVKGVRPFAEKDGSVSFLNEANNSVVWELPRPFMYDADGKTAGVTAKLRTAGEKWFLDLTADQAFLQAADTKYPVTIDPTVDNWDVIRDAFVSSATPTYAYPSSASLYVGSTPTYGMSRSLLQFSLRSLPSDSVINSASINLYNTAAGTADSVVDLYRVTGAMTSSPTWNAQPATAATAESTVTSNAANAYWSWYITRLAKDWYNGIVANNGVQLRMRTETAAARAFNSVNSGNFSPRLTIDYSVDPIGIEDFWGYTKDTVNVTNGNLVIQETDITTPGRGPEVRVTRTHNNRSAGTAGMFGYGWFSNVESVVWEAGVGPATLLDEDRTRHVFGHNSAGEYAAATDVKLQLVKNASGSYTVSKPDGIDVTYNLNGRISTIADDAGNVVRYTYDANNRLTSIADASGRATSFAYGANGYVSSVTAPGNRVTTYAYDTAGNLTTVTGPDGVPETFVYDASHRVTQTKVDKAVTNVTYDASNRCSTISKPITVSGTVQNSVTTIAYDPANLTTSVTDPSGHVSKYVYDTVLNLATTVDNPGAADEAVVTYTYDPDRNLTSMIDPLNNKSVEKPAFVTLFENGKEVTSQLPSGATSTVEYDPATGEVDAVTDYSKNRYEMFYKPDQQEGALADPLTQTSSTRYREGGLMEYATYPIAAAENFAINASFELDQNADGWADNWSRQFETGKTATFTWVNGGRFGKKSVSIANPTGWAVVNSEMIPYTAGERFSISGYVKTTNATGPAYVRMEYYDANSKWLGEQRSSPIRGTQEWTRLQALVVNPPAGTAKMRPSLFMTAGTGMATFDGIQVERGHVISTYNLLENPGVERDADGNNLPDFWGTSGSLITGDGLIKTTAPDPNNVRVGNNSFRIVGERGKQKFLMQRVNVSGDASTPFTLSGWSKQTGADPSGGNYVLQVGLHPAGITDPALVWSNAANTFSKVEDDWQFVSARILPAQAFDYLEVYLQYYDQTGSAIFDGLRLQPGNAHTFYSYDPKGNYLTKEVSPTGLTTAYTVDERGNQLTATDPMLRVIRYQYDARDKITQVTDPSGNTVKTSYTPTGQIASVTDAKNGTTTFGYNEFLDMISKKDALGRTITYDYDKVGNRTKQTNPNGSVITRAYNEDNVTQVSFGGQQVHTVTYNVNGAPASSTDSNGRTLAYEYNVNGLLDRLVQGPASMKYVYSGNNLLTSHTLTGTTSSETNYTYNPTDMIASIARNGVLHTSYVYNERGGMTTIQRTNGLFTTYEYNDDQRLKFQREYNVEGDLLTTYELGYEEHGNISSVSTKNGTTTYTYDANNQLTYETFPDGTQIRYTYDANGNRTQRTTSKGGVTISTTTTTYDAANQLKTINGQPYTHDANGNLTSGGGITYVYDAEDRLTAVKNAAGATLASYGYDYSGLRTSMNSAAGTVYYHYNNAKPQRLIAETDASGKIIAEYTWDAHGRPATMTRNGFTYYYHHNGHGDVILLTDSTGNSVAQYQYDAWGTITSQSGSMAAANPFRYAGYQYDEATGLYYLYARYYAPTFGRFLTRDPEIHNAEPPVTVNPYAYSKNDPLQYVDETGENPFIAVQVGYVAYRWAATWGNHCGWKRGKAGVKCKDLADACCYRHDRCYDTRVRNSCSCDSEMISCNNKNMSRMKTLERLFAKRANWYFNSQKNKCKKERANVTVKGTCPK